MCLFGIFVDFAEEPLVLTYEHCERNPPLAHNGTKPHFTHCVHVELTQGFPVMSNDLTRGERLQIMLTEEELQALDDFRFRARMPSRASAVRELLKRGLAAEGFLSAGQGQKSEDFGVTDGDALSKRPAKPPKNNS